MTLVGDAQRTNSDACRIGAALRTHCIIWVTQGSGLIALSLVCMMGFVVGFVGLLVGWWGASSYLTIEGLSALGYFGVLGACLAAGTD